MRIVVLSNDVIPGFGAPVAAPGIRAAGLAEGLRAHGHDVTVAVPDDLLAQLFGPSIPSAPDGAVTVAPPDLMSLVDEIEPAVVVFINANLTPHVQPRPGVTYVYDLFAPKLLELEASSGIATAERDAAITNLTAIKARAMALADVVWVNGARKRDYAVSWLERDEVVKHARPFGRDRPTRADVIVVEMPVPLPTGNLVEESSTTSGAPTAPTVGRNSARRLGIAGYAQPWSTLAAIHPGHQLLVDAGHQLHALLPGHWGGNPSTPPVCALPDTTVHHQGPMQFGDFATWVQSMHAMVDIFAPSPERRLAMITRSAVALRLGVPLIHAVDSEISDIVVEHNAGWVLDPSDTTAWHQVLADLADPTCVAAKTAGAREASAKRFAPEVALREASDQIERAAQ